MAHKETGEVYDLLELAYKHRDSIAADVGTLVSEASSGELAALISYAIAFPQRFVALVDTYDVKRYDLPIVSLCFYPICECGLCFLFIYFVYNGRYMYFFFTLYV